MADSHPLIRPVPLRIAFDSVVRHITRPEQPPRPLDSSDIHVLKHTYSPHMRSRCRSRRRTTSNPKTRSGFPSASAISCSLTSFAPHAEARGWELEFKKNNNNNPLKNEIKSVSRFFKKNGGDGRRVVENERVSSRERLLRGSPLVRLSAVRSQK